MRVAILFALLFALVWSVGCSQSVAKPNAEALRIKKEAQSREREAQQRALNEQRKLEEQAAKIKYAECKKFVEKSLKLGVIDELVYYDKRISHVVVRDKFYELPYRAKKGCAYAISCSASNGHDNCVNYYLKDWRTGKKVGSYVGCYLTMD